MGDGSEEIYIIYGKGGSVKGKSKRESGYEKLGVIRKHWKRGKEESWQGNAGRS